MSTGRAHPFTDRDQHPLVPFLEFAVPLKILEYQDQGGPTLADIDLARSQYPNLIGGGADVMLFGSGKPGQAGQSAILVANYLAILAFSPGGVTAFGQHWEVK